MGHIPQLWIRTYYALEKAIAEGHLLKHPEDPRWLFLPGTDASTLRARFRRNVSTYRMWTEPSRDIGSHSHVVVRRMLASKGFRQPKTVPTFYLDSGREVAPDAYTLTPIRAAFEVKNGLSDIWPDPRAIRQPSADQQQIMRHFQMCKENEIIPAFIGVKFDPTFYGFVKDNNGLCFELGFQIFPPHLATLTYAIASDLGFRNIVVVSEDPPYPPELIPFLQWLDTIKQLNTP